jgi:hypothetical protein
VASISPAKFQREIVVVVKIRKFTYTYKKHFL